MTDARSSSPTCEVVIVGGGPAGLSAALVLGRCRRQVVVFDDGLYRNAASHAVHGFITREGIHPGELRRLAREEIARYPSVEFRADTVVSADCVEGGFELTTKGGERLRCRKLLIATGLVDHLPPVPGAEQLLGRSVHHCPYCEGWEVRDAPLFVYATGDDGGARFALELTLWSRDLVLCTNGPCELSPRYRERLEQHEIPVETRSIARFEGDDDCVRIVFSDGAVLERRALFFNLGCAQRCELAENLGCAVTHKGGIEVGRLENTKVAGLYIAGDASRDALQAIVGAGEGSTAAIAINSALIAEDLY